MRAELLVDYPSATPFAAVEVPAPEDPETHLGKLLFFSKTLGGDFDTACATCHHPVLGGGDSLSLPVGVAALTPDFLGPGRVIDPALDKDPRADGGPNVPRNSQTTFNTALYDRALFHDGRVFVLDEETVPGGAGQALRTMDSNLNLEDLLVPPDAGLLDAQARFPVVNPNEMRGRGLLLGLDRNADVRDRLVARLRGLADADRMPANDWEQAFRTGFPALADAPVEQLITFDNVARAIAAYERSQLFVDTPFHRFLGGDDAAISAQAQRGALLFFRAAGEGGYGCAGCHAGPNFSDEAFHVAGFPQIGRGKRVDYRDLGRYGAVQQPANLYAFRTPSLLNVAVTGPWGHAGTFADLEHLIRYHADPVSGVEAFDWSLSHLPQFAGTTITYPSARTFTREAIFVETDNGEELRLSPLLPLRAVPDEDVVALRAFLESLTDPCVTSATCLARWIPDVADDPDGNQLARGSDPLAGRPGGGSGGGGGGSGGGSGGGGGGSGGGSDGAPWQYVSPVAGQGFLGQHACGDQVGLTPTFPGFFVERALALGIDHVHGHSLAFWQLAFDEAMQSGGVAAGYVDGDCWPDLVFSGGLDGGALVYLNDGGDGFALPVSPVGAAGRDYSGPALADLDGDFRPEILLANLVPGMTTVLAGDPGGGFPLRQELAMPNDTYGIAFADITGDAAPDVFAAHWDRRRIVDASPATYRNVGGVLEAADADVGTLASDVPRNFHFSPGFVDIDADGDQDMLVAADFLNSEVLRNDAGVFAVATDRQVINDQNGMGSAIADFDRDGKWDWFVSAIAEPQDGRLWPYGMQGNRLYRGNGDGTFIDITDMAGVRRSYWAWGSCAADFNNDGAEDIFVVNGYGLLPDDVRALYSSSTLALIDLVFAGYNDSRPSLFLNRGDGTFDDVAYAWGFSEPVNGRGISCVDYDRDGDMDIAVAQNGARPMVYENGTGAGPGAHFLRVHLVAPPPNTAAIGAVVRVRAGGRTAMHLVAANSNYLGQDLPDVHAGLGGSVVAEEVEVTWPDGVVTTYHDVAANSFLTLHHPALAVTSLTGVSEGVLQSLASLEAYLAGGAPGVLALEELAALRWRFGLAGASATADAYQAEILVREALGDAELAALMRQRARRFDASMPVPLAEDWTDPRDRLVIPALFCRERAMPAWWRATIESIAYFGTGSPADALEALLYQRDRGCTPGVSVALWWQLVQALDAGIDTSDGVDEAELRSLALLVAAGREDLVTGARLSAVLAAANGDGGWPASGSGASDSLASVRAYALLLGLARPERLLLPALVDPR